MSGGDAGLASRARLPADVSVGRRGPGPHPGPPAAVLPRAIAEAAMRIAASICLYTNDQLVIEELA